MKHVSGVELLGIRLLEMGAGQSTSSSPDEKVFQTETPISVSLMASSFFVVLTCSQFSPDVVNQLSDRMDSPETTPERQSILDAHIRARIHDELEHLKRDEEQVRNEIERALERENLDREKSMAGDASEGDGSSAGDIRNSAALLGDLEEIKSKIEKYQSNKKSSEYPEVEASGSAVAECYKYVPVFKSTFTPEFNHSWRAGRTPTPLSTAGQKSVDSRLL